MLQLRVLMLFFILIRCGTSFSNDSSFTYFKFTKNIVSLSAKEEIALKEMLLKKIQLAEINNACIIKVIITENAVKDWDESIRVRRKRIKYLKSIIRSCLGKEKVIIEVNINSRFPLSFDDPNCCYSVGVVVKFK